MKSRKLWSKALLGLAAVMLAVSSAGTALADDPLPVPWNGMDIGGPRPAGTAKTDGGVFMLSGAGGELAGAGDRFHFVYQSLTGDCALVARVSAGANASDLMAAGIMARQALASTSDFVAVTLTPGYKVTSIYRNPLLPQTAAESVSAASPVWLKLVKRGLMVQIYMASDRVGAPGVWKQVGGNQPIPSGMIYVGLCLASHAQGGTATFDHVSLKTGSQLVFDDGKYTISPASTPGVVLMASGSEVKFAPLGESVSQKWRLASKGGGFYSLQPFPNPSLALTVPGAKSSSGSPVAVAADQGQDTQRWSIVTNSNGTYSLLPQFNTSICLDDFGGNATPDAVIDIWNYDSTDPHLQWMINSAP